MAREPVLPTLRAAIFAAVCLGLGAGAHRVMSGAAIPVWALMIGAVGAYLPARYAAGRGERGLLGIGALMGGVQVALHLLFCYAQHAGTATGGPGTVPATAMPAGMAMPAGAVMRGMPGMPAADVSASAHMSLGMLLGHALAALVCAWWLRRGEAALHAVLRAAVFRFRGLWVAVFVLPPADRTPRTARVEPRQRALCSQWLRGVAAERGPPRLSVQP